MHVNSPRMGLQLFALKATPRNVTPEGMLLLMFEPPMCIQMLFRTKRALTNIAVILKIVFVHHNDVSFQI